MVVVAMSKMVVVAMSILILQLLFLLSFSSSRCLLSHSVISPSFCPYLVPAAPPSPSNRTPQPPNVLARAHSTCVNLHTSTYATL